MPEQHTPEPWSTGHLCIPDVKCNCEYIFGNDDRMGCVATVAWGKDGDDHAAEYPNEQEAAANQRRIIACVNLCEKLTTSEAETISPLQLHDALARAGILPRSALSNCNSSKAPGIPEENHGA